MGIESLSLFLDILILLGLVTTIYFALRLSKSLGNFRRQRKEFERIMSELNHNIEQAHQSLLQIKRFSGSYDDDMKVSLDEAKDLLDELRLMNQSGNNLADRLEQLASQSRYINKTLSEESDEDDYDEQIFGHMAAMEDNYIEEDDNHDVLGDQDFDIQDRDFEHPFEKPESGSQSRAEQELIQALQRNKKRSSG